MVVSTEADAEEMKRLDERFQAARATNDGCDQGTHNVNVDRKNHDVFHVTDNASLDPKPTSDPERSDNMKNTRRKAGKARAKRLEKARVHLEAMPEEERNRLVELMKPDFFRLRLQHYPAFMPFEETKELASNSSRVISILEQKLEELDRQEQQIDDGSANMAAGSTDILEQMLDEDGDSDSSVWVTDDDEDATQVLDGDVARKKLEIAFQKVCLQHVLDDIKKAFPPPCEAAAQVNDSE